jgi:hypothetical protein
VSVQASKKVYLHPDNSLTVTVSVKCLPGWFSSDIDVWLGQATDYAEGHAAVEVACDGAWHAVPLALTATSSPLHVGAVSIASQFVAYNNDTGDPVGAHDNQLHARIHAAHTGH